MRMPTSEGLYQWGAAGLAMLSAYMLKIDSFADWNWFHVITGAAAHISAGLAKLGLTPDSKEVPVQPTTIPVTPFQWEDDELDVFEETKTHPERFFSDKSRQFLSTCHPDLQRVAERALKISKYDFAIICGERTLAEQKVLFDSGKSQTMQSRHVISPSHAFDFAVYVDGKITWVVEPYYREVVEAIKTAAKELDIRIVSGIDWKTLVDAGHIELDRSAYPDVTLA